MKNTVRVLKPRNKFEESSSLPRQQVYQFTGKYCIVWKLRWKNEIHDPIVC